MSANKCKNCGGELNFDIESQQLKCTHCSSIFEFEKEKKELEKKEFTEESTINLTKTKYTQFLCKTCGRKHITPVDTPLTRCPCCGDSNLEKTLKVDYTPDGIIPFKITKNIAQANLMKWLKHQKFVPNNLKKLARTQALNGVYIPSYIYDFNTTTNYSGIGVNSYRGNNNTVHYTRQSFRNKSNKEFVNYIESAGSTIPSLRLRSIGNFSPANIHTYRTEFLYGWVGEQVSINLQDNCKNMQNDVAQTISFQIRSSLPYERIENFICNTQFAGIKYSYVYLPVWKGIYKYNNKPYSYYVNGESGKVYGRTPKSFWKIFFTALGIGALIAGFVYLVTQL